MQIWYTERKGQIEPIQHVQGNLYQSINQQIEGIKRLIRVPSEVFKSKKQAQKYFNYESKSI